MIWLSHVNVHGVHDLILEHAKIADSTARRACGDDRHAIGAVWNCSARWCAIAVDPWTSASDAHARKRSVAGAATAARNTNIAAATARWAGSSSRPRAASRTMTSGSRTDS